MDSSSSSAKRYHNRPAAAMKPPQVSVRVRAHAPPLLLTDSNNPTPLTDRARLLPQADFND